MNVRCRAIGGGGRGLFLGWRRDDVVVGCREKLAVPGFHRRRRKEVAKAGGRAEPFIYALRINGSLN